MKFIFDFDGVLLNTKQFIKHICVRMEEAGVSEKEVKEYYGKVGGTQFSLKKMLAHFSISENLNKEILSKGRSFINEELLTIIKNLGKENCYMVTHANREWQLDKIKHTGIEPFFSGIEVVSESKKEAVEKICEGYRNEPVIFVDDKEKYFEDLDFVKYPNLKTILYDDQGLEKLKSILL